MKFDGLRFKRYNYMLLLHFPFYCYNITKSLCYIIFLLTKCFDISCLCFHALKTSGGKVIIIIKFYLACFFNIICIKVTILLKLPVFYNFISFSFRMNLISHYKHYNKKFRLDGEIIL